VKRKVQRCGCCGETGHNIRSCAIAKLPWEQQWAILFQLAANEEIRIADWIWEGPQRVTSR